MNWMFIFSLLYTITAILLSIYGFNMLLYTVLFLWVRWQSSHDVKQPATLIEWPSVTVQLPVYNERLVIERLIDAAAGLDYPRDKLSIQVLDDSTDDTVTLARARITHHRERGIDIVHLHRTNAKGHKAGALADAFDAAKSDYLAVFDADFLPPADFLRRIMPHFTAPDVGMVQARWGHLNAEYNPLTRVQAIAIDGHHVIEQTVRSRLGLMLNFNGSAGVWRRECIAAVGGWQADTLAEDLDLSYRAQLAGWQLRFAPDVVAPAEVPPRLPGYKRQQFRWAKGSIQTLRKLSGTLLRSRHSIIRKFFGLAHLSGYLAHPLMIVLLLTTIPAMLIQDVVQMPLGALGIAGLGAPLLYICAQWAAYEDWGRRIAYLPVLLLLGIGVALNNTWAVIEALTGHNATLFLRTPKYDVLGKQVQRRAASAQDYLLSTDWTLWGELLLALYGLAATVIAIRVESGLAPFTALYAAGFAYTAWQGWHNNRRPFGKQIASRKTSRAEWNA